jgi:hypothetical protein
MTDPTPTTRMTDEEALELSPPRINLKKGIFNMAHLIETTELSQELIEDFIRRNLFPKEIFSFFVRYTTKNNDILYIVLELCCIIFKNIRMQNRSLYFVDLIKQKIPLPTKINIVLDSHGLIHEDQIIRFYPNFLESHHCMFLSIMQSFYCLIEQITRCKTSILKNQFLMFNIFITRVLRHSDIKFVYFCYFLNYFCCIIQSLEVFDDSDESSIDMNLVIELFNLFADNGFCKFNPERINIYFRDTDGTTQKINYGDLICILFKGFDYEKLIENGIIGPDEDTDERRCNTFNGLDEILPSNEVWMSMHNTLLKNFYSKTRHAWICSVVRSQIHMNESS